MTESDEMVTHPTPQNTRDQTTTEAKEPSTSEGSLALRKIALEERRLVQERELKESELTLQREQGARGRWGTPVVAALIAGTIGLVGSFWGSYQSRELERQKQQGNLVLEAIKTGTGETQQAAANLLFLAKAGLIQMADGQRKQLEEVAGSANPLPSLPAPRGELNFKPSSALSPELQRNLQGVLTAFQQYFSTLGYNSKSSKVEVYVDPSSDMLNVYYEPRDNRIVVSASVAGDKDAILREYGEHALVESIGDWSAEVTSHTFLALESGLADYFACSFTNDPFLGETFAAILSQKTDTSAKPYLRNLDNQLKVQDVSSEEQLLQGEVWGGAFWELRQYLGYKAIDSPLFVAWSRFRDGDLVAFRDKETYDKGDRDPGGVPWPRSWSERLSTQNMRLEERSIGKLFIDRLLKEGNFGAERKKWIAGVFRQRGLYD